MSRRNIARSSKFNINVDFQKSQGSTLYDTNTEKKYLDFFGMYASLPLGYNHPIFKTQEFVDEYMGASSFKINNCEFTSKETLEFDKLFEEYAGQQQFTNFHYTCTGALAVEAAIKTCIEYSNFRQPYILSFNNSFHGINSYGGFVTSRFPGADARLNGFPEIFSIKVDCNLEHVKYQLKNNAITCVLVEPIQCSAGDIHQDKQFFQGLRQLCDDFDVPLIFDEIQIGFGGTGKLWYYEHTDVVPDIVIFGKKTQLSGIMAKEFLGKIFTPERSIRLEVTWDGDISDMIRCKHIIKAYKQYDILKNVEKQGNLLKQELSKLNQIENLRGRGLIVGFDLTSQEKRDTLVQALYRNGLICNSTGVKSIRLRPNLAISEKDILSAVSIIEKSLGGL